MTQFAATLHHISDQLAVITDLLRQQQRPAVSAVSDQELQQWQQERERYETMLNNLVAALRATDTISDEDIEKRMREGVK